VHRVAVVAAYAQEYATAFYFDVAGLKVAALGAGAVRFAFGCDPFFARGLVILVVDFSRSLGVEVFIERANGNRAFTGQIFDVVLRQRGSLAICSGVGSSFIKSFNVLGALSRCDLLGGLLIKLSAGYFELPASRTAVIQDLQILRWADFRWFFLDPYMMAQKLFRLLLEGQIAELGYRHRKETPVWFPAAGVRAAGEVVRGYARVVAQQVLRSNRPISDHSSSNAFDNVDVSDETAVVAAVLDDCAENYFCAHVWFLLRWFGATSFVVARSGTMVLSFVLARSSCVVLSGRLARFWEVGAFGIFGLRSLNLVLSTAVAFMISV